MAAASPAPVHVRPSWWGRLFSIDHHPSRLIVDDVLRRRYQRRRLILAIVGGLLGGFGVGITFSHSGVLGASAVAALWIPAILATAVAVLFVLVPLPEIVRWVAVVAIVALSIGLMDVSMTWKIGLALAGFVMSWVIAVVLQFGIGVVQTTAKDFPTALGLILVAAAVGVSVLAGPAPASAQGLDAAECPAGRLELSIDGQTGLFTADESGTPVELRLAEDDDRSIPVSASSDLERGTIVVELIDVQPWPLVPPRPLVIWAGDLKPTADGGATVDGAIRVFQGDSGRLVAALDDVDFETGLVAGKARYRATLNDPITGADCGLDGLIRVTAPPLSTVPGQIGLAAAVAGLGLAGGSMLGGSTFTRNGKRRDDSGTSPQAGHYVRPKLALSAQREVTAATASTGAVYELVLQLQIDEDDDAVYQVGTSELRWLDMVDIGLGGAVSGAGSIWNIPLQIRTDPKQVVLDAVSFDVEVATADGWTLPIGSLLLAGGSHRWNLSAFGGAGAEMGDPLGFRPVETTGQG